MKMLRGLILLPLLFLSPITSGQGLTYEEQVFDFGHVGIDFKLYHTFTYVNRTDKVVTILDLDVTCDCTTVHFPDSLIQPGDTAKFNMIFETKDYLGPTNKSFRVMTDDPISPTLEYFYLSIVGQWYNGLKPDPVSLFFLPGKKEQVVKIPNKVFDELAIIDLVTSNNHIKISYPSDRVDKKEILELKVTPSPSLSAGTFYSTITVYLQTDETNDSKITIPVKIVKY